MSLKGLIYKGLKPVYWSPSSESALAEAEIEYADVTSHSIYVAFKVKDGKGVADNDARLVIWTTTPWTLPANLAISVHPDFIYGEYNTSNYGKLVFLKEFKDNLTNELGLENVELIKEFKGQEMEGIICKHPFYDRDSIVIVGTHVTNDAGTGLVHTAPGHGAEDYVVCLKYNIKPYCPVDEKGYLMKGTGERLEGLFYENANEVVLDILKENNALLKHDTFIHSYPHDWRTGKPLIFRATDQWFCSIEPIREKLIEQIHQTKWYPSWGETRMVNMIKDRTDWCISRQRAWGVPIPIFYNEDGTPIIEEKVFDHVKELFAKYGSNIWYEKEAIDLLPSGYSNPHSPNSKFSKEKDIMDVWFDSGSSFNDVLVNKGHKFPCDLYLEGSDQYRGWFNSSLIISTSVYGVAPYKSVLTHGFVMDEHWEKMSKSKGNGIDPSKIANIYGADILRLWSASVDYQQDVRISENIIKQISEIYRKIRNTLKFMSWNLVGFDTKDTTNDYELVDLFILEKLKQVINEVDSSFENYDFASSLSNIMSFISNDLSSFYLDIAKDTLYCESRKNKRRIQICSVLYKVSEALLRLLNPILPFTMDEFNKNLPGKREVNVQLLNFPKVEENINDDLLKSYKGLLRIRNDVLKSLEDARNKHIIGSSQEASVEIYLKNDADKELLNQFKFDEAAKLFVVSSFKLADHKNDDMDEYSFSFINVKHHNGERCDRCWNYVDDIITLEDGSKVCPRCKKVLEEN